ncbi:FAST kinase domain-containing protein 4 isoform X2 [Lasioglossum baleicum]|uniref:FAST kinase domain-containing protein 4 isoform X2 n=1 Tax=Lasioglossum baleicum TaxID=434251 RepID=UPI003FCC93D6
MLANYGIVYIKLNIGCTRTWQCFQVYWLKQNHEPAPNTFNAEQRENFSKLKLSVYNSLRDNTLIASKIKKSNNINDLLDLIKLPHLSQNEIIKVMDSIIKWVNENNVNNIDSQTDSSNFKKEIKSVEIKDKPSIKKDDIIAKYSDLSTSSMIQEVLKLAQLRRRNPKEIKFLFDNIHKYNEKLSVGQCSTLMFSMAALSYLDEAFLDNMSSKLITTISSVKSNAVNSMVKSMSILKYKNTEFLSHVCQLLLKSEDIPSNVLLNYIHSLSLLGFVTEEANMVIEKYKSQLTIDTLGVDNWLNYVWYLVLLNYVQNSHVESVLNEEFITTIFSAATEINSSQKSKLLNINGAAKYILKDYHGPLLKTDIVSYEVRPHTADKMLYIEALKETLQSISPSPKCFNMNVNTKMGFLVDAECYVDSKCNLTDPSDEAKQEPKPTKLGILVHDYHSYCHGNHDIHGTIKLRERLLENSGYKVVSISYKQFGIDDKLTKREKFLKQRIQKLS